MPSALIDDETQSVIIKKTWCHGQAVAPIYGVICLVWYFSSSTKDDNRHHHLSLLYAGILLPVWCYLSYRCVFHEFSFKTLMVGGILVETAHALVFMVARENYNESVIHMLMMIASGLFFIETLAFLFVVVILRDNLRQHASNFASLDDPSSSRQNYREVPAATAV